MSRGRSTSSGGGGGDTLDCDGMRALVRQYSDLGELTGALFWADKVLALRGEAAGSGAGADCVWLVAQCLVAKGEWHRALHAITSRDLHRSHLLCLHAAARAALGAGEPAHALQLIDDAELESLQHTSAEMPRNRALAGVYVCQATALTALERRKAAACSIIAALQQDTLCYEALNLLVENHTHTAPQDEVVTMCLPVEAQCGGAEAALVRELYNMRVDKYSSPDPPLQPTSKQPEPWDNDVKRVLAHSADAVACRARRLLHACEFEACLRALDAVDPWFCAELRVACLVELKRAPTLFAFAHTLVDRYPQAATPWFAVGCYYFLIGKNEFARRYLAKAKSVEPGAGHVWLAYGHSFAADNEHDQAMAAYFKASQLMPGCHLPFLYISVECSLLNNFAMAERFLGRAAGLSPHILPNVLESNAQFYSEFKEEQLSELTRLAAGEGELARLDAHVPHEAGAAAFAVGKYRRAELLFRNALAQVHQAYNGGVPERWHALLDNLGHACRKNGKCQEALGFHEQALACRPGHAPTYAAMGLCLALLGQTERAIEVFHSALARDPDDAVSLSMLNYLIDQLDYNSDEPVPQFPFPAVSLELPGGAGDAPEPLPAQGVDVTTHSDMSMSFE